MGILNHKIIGEGQPLIILHGLFGSLDNWVTLGKKFGEHYQIVLADQRNHGKSFHSSLFNYQAMAEDLEALIENLELDNPILLGHSMGGKTVMQYAAFHPTVINKIIVADIGPKGYPVHHDQIIKGLHAVDINTIQSREEADTMLSKFVQDPGIKSFLLKNLKRGSNGGYEWKMNLSGISASISNVGTALDYYLPIDVPSLFIRGGASDYILDSDFEFIETVFPMAEFETIEGAGHWLHAERPSEFYDAVMNFLQH